MKEHRPLSYYIGTFLMIGSLAVFLYIYAPIASFFLLPHAQPKIPPTGYYLQIPKINAFAPIVLNVDPWNEVEYRKKLEEGVAHARGTAVPSETGVPGGEETSFLFAHSSDAPWSMSRYNIVFFRLNDLKLHDKILIWNNGEQITYSVTFKKEVWPQEVTYLLDKQESDLILQTCTPIGTSLKRLLVFANKINL